MIGHERVREQLAAAARRGALGHAYLFSGPSSVGKTSMALFLAALLVCGERGPGPCGTCRGCKLLLQGGHPDVRLIERDPERRDLTIEQVRSIEEDIGLAPFEAGSKLFCLAGADALNAPAASALLKTLEEPPPHAVLALCVADPTALPATVRSRCQQISLQPVPAAAIGAALIADHGATAAQAKELAVLARGRPGWAIRALQDQKELERARDDYRLVAGLAFAGPYSRLMAVNTWLGTGKEKTFIQNRERALAFLADLEGWWRDALLVAAADHTPRLLDSVLGAVSSTGLHPSTIVAFLARTQQAAARVAGNASPRLVLEQLVGCMPSIERVTHSA